MKKKDFNGYSFDDDKTRKCMKYVVINGGSLDLNGAYAFQSHKDLKKYLKEGTHSYRGLQAIFKVKDVTKFYSKGRAQ